MNITSKISLRLLRNRDVPNEVHLIAVDDKSRIQYLEIKMSVDQFYDLLSGKGEVEVDQTVLRGLPELLEAHKDKTDE